MRLHSMTRRARVGGLAVALVTSAMVGGAVGPASPATAFPAPGELNDCASPDNGDPVVTGLELSPRSVEVTRRARTVRITVTAEDTGGPGPATGVAAVSAHLGDGRSRSTTLHQVSTGRWEGRFRLVPGLAPGGMQPVSVSLVDRSDGGGVLVTSEKLAADGFSPEVEVRDRSGGDDRRPVLTALSLSRSSVDSRSGERTVQVRARARDDLAGVGGVRVVVERVGDLRLRLASGSRTDGVWTGRLVVGQWIGSGPARLLVVRVFDRGRNRHNYRTDGLRRRGFPHRLEVVARTDGGSPRATQVTAPPAALDVRTADASFPVSFRVVDDASGVAEVSAILVGPDGSPSAGPPARLARVSGTPRDGIWEGTVTVSRCRATTGDWFVLAQAEDERGSWRSTTFTRQPVAVTASDRSPAFPVRGSVLGWEPTRLRVDFAEDVVGVSPSSAVLRRTTFTPAFEVETVTGTWDCHDVAGVPVDCVAGPVRSAVATLPDQPAAGGSYDVVLNPEHVLDVRDLAGNPYRRLPVFLGSRSALR